MEWHWLVFFIVIQLQSNLQFHCVESVESPNMTTSVLLKHKKSHTSAFTAGSHNKKFQQALEDCSWGLATSVFLEDSRFAEFSKYTLDLFPSREYPIIRVLYTSNTLETDEHLRNVIWNSYTQQSVTDFIVFTSCPECVVRTATNIFQKERRGSGALMTNRVRFVIVTWNPVKDLRSLFKSVIFDNVAVVVVNEHTLEINGVYTLMWRSQATREFDTVNYTNKRSKADWAPVCHLFPNMNYGLNGRALVALSKEWVTYLYKTPDQATGNMTYAGFSAAVIEALAEDLNFSFTFVPKPGMDDALSWKDYETLIQNQAADFGVDLYISNMMTYLNTTVSFPVISGDIRGIYKKPRPTEASHFNILRKSGIYIGLLLSLISTVAFYLLIEKCLLKMFAGEMCDKTLPHYRDTQCHKHVHGDLSGYNKRKGSSSSNNSSQINDVKDVFHDVEHIGLQQIAVVDTVQTNQRQYETTKCLTCKRNIQTGRVTEESNADFVRVSTNSRLSACKILFGQLKRANSSRRGTGMMKKIRRTFRKNTQKKFIRTTLARGESSMTLREVSPLKHRSNSTVVLDIGTENDNVLDDSDTGIGKNLAIPCQHENMGNNSQSSEPGNPKTSTMAHLHIMDTFFAFLGSICGQGTLPTPPLFSARLLLYSWCLTLITITAIFNGGLTAEYLDNTDSVPFRTFNGLLSRTDYKWGLYNESTFFKIMEFSKPGTLFHQIYTGVTKFLKTDPFVLGSFEDIHRKLMTEKFVAILDTFSQKYLENVKNLTDLIVLSDVLMPINLGYVFPKDSELEAAFSKQIMKLVEHGVIEDIFRKSFPHYKSERHRKTESNDNVINLRTMIDLIRICGIGATISLVVLILECIVAKTNVLALFRKVFRHSLAAVKHL